MEITREIKERFIDRLIRPLIQEEGDKQTQLRELQRLANELAAENSAYERDRIKLLEKKNAVPLAVAEARRIFETTLKDAMRAGNEIIEALSAQEFQHSQKAKRFESQIAAIESQLSTSTRLTN
jgi:dsDNA-specific endonuclease/ATPase MutS2